MGADLIHLAQDKVTESCEHGDKSSGSIRRWDFFECLNKYYVTSQKYSAHEVTPLMLL
jgi:hypothetical protein